MLILPLLSSCEPCDCQPTEEEPVVNCYNVRYEAEGSGSYTVSYWNGTGGAEANVDVVGSWEYEFDVCTPYSVWIQVSPLDFGDYSCKIYLDDVLWKEASGEAGCAILATPLP